MSVNFFAEVGCQYYEICGATTTFSDKAEYDIYAEDWICPECYDSDEMFMFGMEDVQYTLASAGYGMDEDY